MQLEETPLSEFLGAEEAHGSLFRLGDQVVAQLDLFDDFYSLCWPARFDVKSHIDQAFELIAEALISRRTPSYSGRVRLTLARQGALDEPPIEEVYDVSPPRMGIYDIWELKDLVEPDILTFDFDATNELDLLSRGGVGPETHFGLWADTMNSPGEEREVGITADYASGLPPSTMGFIQSTASPSWQELSASDLGAFWEAIGHHRSQRLGDDG
jgi:hypothetical protein